MRHTLSMVSASMPSNESARYREDACDNVGGGGACENVGMGGGAMRSWKWEESAVGSISDAHEGQTLVR